MSQPNSYVYRYRTERLLGSWRDSLEAAVRDAIRAKQARWDDAGGWSWNVPGRIERREAIADERPGNDNLRFLPEARRRA